MRASTLFSARTIASFDGNAPFNDVAGPWWT
jgi:hypothetical protein